MFSIWNNSTETQKDKKEKSKFRYDVSVLNHRQHPTSETCWVLSVTD